MNGISGLLVDTLAFLAPLIPVAAGGLATEYAGTLNIALEGLILAGAFSYAAVGSILGPPAGICAALGMTALLAMGADWFSRKARADSFVVGLGVNMLVPAATSILSLAVFNTKGVAVIDGLLAGRPFDRAVQLPGIGFLFGLRTSDYLAFALAALVALALALTPFGLRVRAAGMSRNSLKMAGVDTEKVRAGAYAVSGLACGAAGAALVASVGAWVPNMSAGRGWIALVAVYLGGKRLGGTFAASAFFAVLLSIATRAQALPSAPAELLMAAPYFITAIVVIIGSARKSRRGP